jgi:hypothetical protein
MGQGHTAALIDPRIVRTAMPQFVPGMNDGGRIEFLVAPATNAKNAAHRNSKKIDPPQNAVKFLESLDGITRATQPGVGLGPYSVQAIF